MKLTVAVLALLAALSGVVYYISIKTSTNVVKCNDNTGKVLVIKFLPNNADIAYIGDEPYFNSDSKVLGDIVTASYTSNVFGSLNFTFTFDGNKVLHTEIKTVSITGSTTFIGECK